MKTIAQPSTQQILFKENGITAEMCIGQERLEIAYHLRYKAYLNAGAICSNSKEQFTDTFDKQANARTYLIWFAGQPVASIRSLTWSAEYNWQPTPSVQFFEADIKQHLGAKTSILETNCFVVDPAFTGRKALAVHLLLFRIQTLAAMADQCKHVIAAVRPPACWFL